MIKSLPKFALVETQVLLHTGREELSEDDEKPRRCISQFASGCLPGLKAQWEVSRFDDFDAFMIVVGCSNDDAIDRIGNGLAAMPWLQKLWPHTALIRLFHTPSASPELDMLCQRLFGASAALPTITPISVRLVATWTRNWDYAICFIG